MHPIYGDIFTFPWRKAAIESNISLRTIFNLSLAINEFNEALPLFECLKQDIANSLEELDWSDVFTKSSILMMNPTTTI